MCLNLAILNGGLTLNLGHLNRKPCLGGHVKFPVLDKKRSELCLLLPSLVFRNGAHIVALCEANDPGGGIARHQQFCT